MSGLAKYERLAGALRDEIRAGRLAPGAPFPSRADLVARGHSDHAVREALRVLRDEGWIVTRVGAGTTVSDPLPAAEEALDVQATLREVLDRLAAVERRVDGLPAGRPRGSSRGSS